VGGIVVEVGGAVLGLLFVFSLLSLFVVVFFFSCLICFFFSPTCSTQFEDITSRFAQGGSRSEITMRPPYSLMPALVLNSKQLEKQVAELIKEIP
jgi:hypothetical protein